MTVGITNELLVSGATTEQIRWLRDRTTYPNPEFVQARRSGRFTGRSKANPDGIPEFLRLHRIEDLPEGPGAYLPRGLLSEIESRFAPQIVDSRIAPPMSAPVRLGATLRPYQRAAVSVAEEEEQGVIQAPTGSGKTVIGLGLIAAFQTPALFIVHTRVLLDQTAASMAQMLGVTPGTIGDGRCVVQDVTVAMVQTLQRFDEIALRGLTRRFGLIILDEAHHAPAASFRAILSRFPARYRFGLTATPTRKDGMEPLLYDTIGPIIYRVAPGVLIDRGAIVPAEVVRVETHWTPRAKKEGENPIPMVKRSDAQVNRIKAAGYKVRDTTDFTALLDLLTKDAERNQVVLDTVCDLHEERSLVLTDRVEHAKQLTAAIRARGLRAACMTGETSKSERSEALGGLRSGTLPVLVATSALVSEGFDLPTIDTVFLCVPNGNVTKTTQILGRVLRPAKGKARGRIVDFRDSGVPNLVNQARARDKVYATFERGELPLRRTA